jgi:putative endonuclease
MKTTDIGNRGELLVSEELTRLGYEVIERNWKNRWAEIDIVARKNDIIYFVEVKYRSSSNQGDGLDYITDQKLHHMMRAAELWVGMGNWKGEYQLLAASVDSETKDVDLREVV